MNRAGWRRGICWLILAALGAFLLASGCSERQNVKTNEVKPAEQKQHRQGVERLAVYYVKITDNDAYLVREVHELPQSGHPMQAALEQLIKGTPQTPGASRVLPAATRVLGISLHDGLATVDFSKEVLNANVGSAGEALGIQSIVNTLTEFPGVNRVAFRVEGKLDERARDWWGHVGLYNQPFKRDLNVVREPVIWVTEPAPGSRVQSPLTVRGTAMVFEATVSLRLLTSDGKKLVQSYVNATAGAPARGDFEAVLSFTPPASGSGYLEVYWNSPKDGAELDTVRVPVKF